MPDYKRKIGIYAGIVVIFFAACLLCMAFGNGKGKIKGIENAAVSFDEFKIPEDAKVIGIGEATHGNREFQQVKLEMLQKLVETGKCKSIAFEISVGEGAMINDAIHESDTDLTELIGGCDYPLYDTEDMVNLLEWMRKYNEGCEYDDSVCFYGIDIQGSYRGLEYLINLSKKKPGILSEEETVKLRELIDVPGRIPQDSRGFMEDLLKRFSEMGEDEYGEAIYCLETVLVQMEAPLYDEDPAGYGNYRDDNMARNVKTIYDTETKRGYSQILVTAHNGHVIKKGEIVNGQVSMGERIGMLFPGSYYCVGTEFFYSNDNIHTAGTYDDAYERADHEFCSADKIAYQAKDHKDGRFVLDFASVKESDGEVYKLIHGDNFTGLMGEGYTVFIDIYKTYRYKITVADHYDAMIYYYKVNPIRLIHY